MVRHACGEKLQAYKAEQMARLRKEYGEPVDISMAELATSFQSAGTGKHSIEVTNKESARVLTLIRLQITPAPGPGTNCDPARNQVYAYKTLVKPGRSAKLVYPAIAESYCIAILSAYAKQSSWLDVAFSSTINPLPVDPHEKLKK